jgi:hypothetical protein
MCGVLNKNGIVVVVFASNTGDQKGINVVEVDTKLFGKAVMR